MKRRDYHNTDYDSKGRYYNSNERDGEHSLGAIIGREEDTMAPPAPVPPLGAGRAERNLAWAAEKTGRLVRN